MTSALDRFRRPAAPAPEPVACIAADPAWLFDDKLPGEGVRGAEKHYTCLTVDEICRLVLPPMLPDCYLFLWRVSSMVEEAYRVVRAWGFVPKTELVWRKLTVKDKRWFGMGRTLRAEHETCIIATRGRPKVLDRAVRSCFDADELAVEAFARAEARALVEAGDYAGAIRMMAESIKGGMFWGRCYGHSRKPEEFYELVENLVPGPRAELFARQHREGWTCYGDELGTPLVVRPAAE